MEKKEKNYKGASVILLLAVAFLVVFVGVGIYNAPTNRVQRQVDSGNKYLEEERYEEAAVAFEQAIATDARCMEAYVGGIEAYQHMGDAESLRALYDRAVDAAGELDADMVAENMDYLVRIYLLTEEIYGNEPIHAVDCLIEGYRLTDGNEQIKEQLIEIYMRWADQLTAEADYEKAIAELTKGYEEIPDARLEQKLEDVQEQYRQYLEWKAYMEYVDDILVRIAASCQEEDYQAVFTLMQSEEYAKFLERIDEIEETVGLETEYGDIGLYKVESEEFGNYMIYYGEYDGAARQGTGIWLGYYESNNYMAKGNWTDDLPQGEFEVREWSGRLAEDVVYRVISGNVDKGLWNGDVLWGFEETDGTTSSYPVSFQNGKWVILRYNDEGNAVVCEAGSGNSGGNLVVVPGHEDYILGIEGIAPDY